RGAPGRIRGCTSGPFPVSPGHLAATRSRAAARTSPTTRERQPYGCRRTSAPMRMLGNLMQATVDGQTRSDAIAVMEQMGRYHPSEPHWYLPLIGVDPSQQGKGYGTALMRYALDACDGDRAPAYLESTNPRNVPLYQRHGFELLGTIQGGGIPPLFTM